jgi:hypothetical protein
VNVETILGRQAPSGAFLSTAHLPAGPVNDENAFVTALVIDLLIQTDPHPALANAIERALEFLLRCQHPGCPGAFCFYPADAQPAWIGESLPPDTDDTALCSIALFRAGRWSRGLRRQVHDLLGRYRLATRPRGEEWFRAGVYPTWLDSARLCNPIDVCVNINVLTLIKLAGLDSRHGDGILEMVGAALDWAGDRPDRARLITPYYPHPSEMEHALERAANARVHEAQALRARMSNRSSNASQDPSLLPVCCSLGGGVVWTSPALQAARAATR